MKKLGWVARRRLWITGAIPVALFRLAPASVLAAALAACQSATVTPAAPAAALTERDCYSDRAIASASPESVMATCARAARNERITVMQYANANLQVGHAAVAVRNYQEAERALGTAVDLYAGRTAEGAELALHDLARTYAGQRRFDLAITRLNQLLAAHPANIDALYDLGDAYMETGATDDAVRAYTGVISATDADPKADRRIAARAGVRLGTLALQDAGADAAARAIDLFSRARQADPTRSEASMGLGDAHARLAALAGDGANAAEASSQALAAYREAARLSPQAADPVSGAARSLMALGRTDEAVVQYRRAVELSPDAGRHADLARAQRAAGRLEEAERSFSQATALEPANARLLVELADVQTALRRPDLARASLEQALRVEPGNLAAQLGLGRILFAQGPAHHDGARDQFAAVERQTRGQADPAVRAEAVYYLSRIATEGDGVDRPRAVVMADEAVSLAGTQWRYREQACLARIRFLNKTNAASEDVVAHCASADGRRAAEMDLLQGMLALRAAHFARGDDKKRSWEEAYRAFTAGLKLSAGAAESASLTSRLELGQGLAHYCVGFADIGRATIAGADQDARAYFDTYHVAQCADY